MERSGETEGILGRETEIAALRAFLAEAEPGRALVVTGEAGIGKTTIWEAGLELAERSGYRVLSARPGDGEAQLSFATLSDLLDGVSGDELDPLPSPQRHALDVALLRVSPDESAPGVRAIGLAFQNTLTNLAERRPLVIAIDDVQWIDPLSADVLSFAARRLGRARVRFLLAKRSGAAELPRILDPARVDELAVLPLSLGVMRRLLLHRLDLTLTRRSLNRVVEAAQGNPFFVLEIGRTILTGDMTSVDGELVVPDRVEELLGTRISSLAEPVRRLLLAVAVCPTVRADELAAIADKGAVEDAVEAGVLVVEGAHVRPSHPLLAAAALRRLSARERREVSLALAGVARDPLLEAKLRAGATTEPDEGIADELAAAAVAAEQRGSVVDALQLTEHALRLTPPHAVERGGRVVGFARLLAITGQTRRFVEFLTGEIGSLPAGRERAEAYFGLASEATDPAEIEDYLERALAEVPDDRGIRAAATSLRCLRESVIELRDVDGGERRLAEVVADAPLAGPDLEHEVLLALIWINALRGYAVADLAARFPAASIERLGASPIPVMVDGQRLARRGELDRARDLLSGLMTNDALGERYYALARYFLCDLELRAGELEAAEQLLTEWGESTDGEEYVWPMYERCRAGLAAARGLPLEVERWVAIALERARGAGGATEELEALRLQGLASLFVGDPQSAADTLRTVWEHTQREGITEPGAFPVVPDLVEALVELGLLDEARQVTARLLELSTELDHPWGLVTSRRCAVLVALVADQGDDARQDLGAVAADYGELGLRFDRARCLLALGRSERRQKKWGAARASLEQAEGAFEEIGSVGWVEQARAELSRLPGRRPQQKGMLTPTEHRVASLAAKGLANKEIAAALHVSVHTVEAHLSHAYAKLGVRSRSQLAARLAAET